MKTQIIAFAAAAALVAGTVDAAPKNKPHRGENAGVGAGAVVGAILGGPVGFLIGTATGGWLGGKIDDDRAERERLEVEVQTAETQLEAADALAESLKASVMTSEGELDELRLVMNRQETLYRDALQEAFAIEVYFHTGEAALEQTVAERIGRVGEILRNVDDFSVVIEGHADPRGDDGYNEQLSAERAAAVRDALIGAGLPADRITTRAAGERNSRAQDGDLDAMALERRVNLSIVYPSPRNRVARQ